MTTNTKTISPTDIAFYAKHSTEALHNIVARYGATANAMIGSPLGIEALAIEFAARAELIRRGEG